jgi:hypothetical protein
VVAAADTLLVAAEVKAGSWTPTSPANDFAAFQASAKALFEMPARQADRFLRTLEEEGSLDLCDSSHKKSATLQLADYDRRHAMCVTLDSMTVLAAQAEYLGPLGTDISQRPTWVLSLDDLQTCSEILTVPGQFAHFMAQRMAAIGSDHARTMDEGDHLGLYLEHLLYTQHTKQFEGVDHIAWDYTGKLDRYYSELFSDPDTATPPNHDYSGDTLALLRTIQKERRPGHVRALCYLLDIVPSSLNGLIAKAIAYISGQESHGRIGYFSLGGEHALVLVTTREGIVRRNPARARDHALASILLYDAEPCLSMQLHYGADKSLASAEFALLRKSDVPPDRLDELRQLAETLRVSRHRRRVSAQVGRNDRCPCGSGKKYKRCCLPRGL